jgi:hypothetical protein
LVTNNKFDFYNITEIADKKYKILDKALKNVIVRRIFTIHQLAHFLIIDLEKDIKKYKSKLVVITGDFFVSDPQITREDKDWLYPNDTSNQKGSKFYHSCLFSNKTVRVSKLWIIDKKV